MDTNKVLVINEPFVENFNRAQRWAARTRGRVLRAPDWLAYTTAILEKAGVDVELYDFPAKFWGKEKLRELVRQKQPRVVVLDTTTPSIYSDIDCARIVKEESPRATVLFVGPHGSSRPEETLRNAAGAVDAIAVGEYEYTVRDYVAHELDGENRDLSTIPGLAYLDGEGLFQRNAPRPIIENLDELPFPAWNHLDLNDYFDGGKLHPYVTVIGGRGCPYTCKFCLWPQVMHGHKYRFRSPESIVAEMEWVLKNWPEVKNGEFFFEDDTFTVNRQRAHKLCDLIIARKLNCTFSVNSRADVTDAALLRHMREAGCRLVLVGFESGSQVMLDSMNKQIAVPKMEQFIRIAKEVGLQVHGCFVLGMPGETEATMQETIDFALRNPLDTVQFSSAVPYPGTEYFDILEKNNLLRAKRWDQWLQEDGEQSAVVEYPGLSKSKVEEYVDKGLKQFYFRPSYMWRFLMATRSKTDLYRKLRGFRNFVHYLVTKK
ncbi:MAG: radical SAM protein [Magnetococcales bacterium]|nr:radical SAM protein [Magnetococcales bacterium]